MEAVVLLTSGFSLRYKVRFARFVQHWLTTVGATDAGQTNDIVYVRKNSAYFLRTLKSYNNNNNNNNNNIY